MRSHHQYLYFLDLFSSRRIRTLKIYFLKKNCIVSLKMINAMDEEGRKNGVKDIRMKGRFWYQVGKYSRPY